MNGTRINADDRRTVLAERRDNSWRDKAACRDTDPDLFFPVGWTGPAVEQIDQAKQVCAQCVVKGPCLDYAVITNQEGVWGGTDEGERVLIRAGLRQQAGKPTRGRPRRRETADA